MARPAPPKLFEQTSSAKRSVRCAGVIRPGPHFVEVHSDPEVGRREGGVRARHAGTDHGDAGCGSGHDDSVAGGPHASFQRVTLPPQISNQFSTSISTSSGV